VVALWKATKDLPAVVPHWLLLAESAARDEAQDEDAGLRQLIGVGAASQLQKLGSEQPRDLISTLLPLLADESPVLRRSAARTLGTLAVDSKRCRRILKQQAVRSSVAPLLDDPDESVRAHAAVALERLPK
jgi:HEAT repeat protein